MSGVNGIEESATTSSRTTETLSSSQRTWLPFLWVTASIAVLVSLAEVSRLSGSILDLEGRVWAFTELMGPSAWASRAGWQSTFQEDDLWRRLLRVYLGFDVLLIIGYGFALRYVLRFRAFSGWLGLRAH